MNKYIKKFKTLEQLGDYVLGPDYVTPNLLYVEGLGTVGSKKLNPVTFTITNGGECPKGGDLRSQGCGRIQFVIPPEITSAQLIYVECSVDEGETWVRYTVPGDTHEQVEFGPTELGQFSTVMFRGKGNTLVAPVEEIALIPDNRQIKKSGTKGAEEDNWTSCYFTFGNVNEAECRGDVMSLLQLPIDVYEQIDNKPTRGVFDEGQFWYLFESAPITTMPNLPKKINYEHLGYENYQGMFANSSVEYIFLPEKVVPSGCYDYMFQDCRNIREITILAEEWEDGEIHYNMFENSNVFNDMINLYIPSKMFSWYMEQGVISPYWHVEDYKTGEVLQEGEAPQQEI